MQHAPGVMLLVRMHLEHPVLLAPTLQVGTWVAAGVQMIPNVIKSEVEHGEILKGGTPHGIIMVLAETQTQLFQEEAQIGKQREALVLTCLVLAHQVVVEAGMTP